MHCSLSPVLFVSELSLLDEILIVTQYREAYRSVKKGLVSVQMVFPWQRALTALNWGVERLQLSLTEQADIVVNGRLFSARVIQPEFSAQ